MKKVIIIAGNPIGYALASEILQLSFQKVEIVSPEKQELIRILGPEPLPIKNYELNMIEPPTYYEQQSSKFISKPKNNFKRR